MKRSDAHVINIRDT